MRSASRRACWPPRRGVLMAWSDVPRRSGRSARGVEVENMRVGFDASLSSLKSSNSFKIGAWTPVWVQLRGGSEPWSGFMEVSVADDDGTPTAFRMPVEVGANQSERFTAYARPGSRQPEFTIRLLDQNGRRVGGASQDTVMPQPPESIMPNETLLLTMGRPQGVEMIKDLPGFQTSGRRAARNSRGRDRDGTYRPAIRGRCRAAGTATMRREAVVVDTADREAILALDALRGQPLVDWVARGAIWSSRSVPTGRRCAIACSGRSCRDRRAGK